MRSVPADVTGIECNSKAIKFARCTGGKPDMILRARLLDITITYICSAQSTGMSSA